jgi:hypothetical protein
VEVVGFEVDGEVVVGEYECVGFDVAAVEKKLPRRAVKEGDGFLLGLGSDVNVAADFTALARSDGMGTSGDCVSHGDNLSNFAQKSTVLSAAQDINTEDDWGKVMGLLWECSSSTKSPFF